MNGWAIRPWPPARTAGEGPVRGPEYDESVIVTDAQREAASARAGSFARSRLRQWVHAATRLQVRDVHAVLVYRGEDQRGVCSCGLLLPAGAKAGDVRGHRAMPGLGRIAYLVTTPAASGDDDRYDLACQRCGYEREDLNDGQAIAERTAHQRVCAPGEPWPRRTP